jgi:hypothetical protein
MEDEIDVRKLVIGGKMIDSSRHPSHSAPSQLFLSQGHRAAAQPRFAIAIAGLSSPALALSAGERENPRHRQP